MMYFFGMFLLWTVSTNGLKEPRVVYPRLLEERSSDGAMVVRVHDQLTLSLKKASVAAPELRVLTEENGKTITHIYNGEDIEKDLYEDEENIATVSVTKDEYGVYMNGLVGPKHRIEPMPFAERMDEGVVPHAIHEVDLPQMMDQTVRHTEQEKKPSERQSGQQPPPVPDVVQIELFFVVDRPHHSHFGSEAALLLYLCVTINAVSLRYRRARNPKISFIVTGVEMSVTETYAVVFPNNQKFLYDRGTLDKLRDYAYTKAQNFKYPDVVFLLTGRDLYGVINGNVSVNSAGIGYVASVCTKTAVALGEDTAGLYTGVHTVTHELAHVLGAEHDGEEPTYVGHPGAKSCSWYNGNIMSYVDKGPNHNQFSDCSLRQMQYVITNAGIYCWEVRSRGYSAQATYPGMVVSQLAYCKERVQDTTLTVQSYTVNETTCKVRCQLYRLHQVRLGRHTYQQKSWMYQDFNALDYTTCGNDTSRVCVQGVCVKKPIEPAAATTKKYKPVRTTPLTKAITTPTASATTQCICDCRDAAPPKQPTRQKPLPGTGAHNGLSQPGQRPRYGNFH
uniref:Reprolysin n=1 Tax=Rhipicephalus appendiculatus TaxID=34631 RepID=A0A131YLA9_RHIAP